MYSELGRADREEICRRYTQAAEAWLRRLIHLKLSAYAGPKYLTDAGIVKNEVATFVQKKLSDNPHQFVREVDATTFEQAVVILTHPQRWRDHFAPALEMTYPLGPQEAKIFLDRLIEIRNDVAHGRSVSLRHVEKAICYTNDLADGIKEHLRKLGMDREFDVPLIVSFSDNIGNRSDMTGVPLDMSGRIIDWRGKGKDLRPGDVLVVEVEVDPSFDEGSYTTHHGIRGTYGDQGKVLTLQVDVSNVGEQFELFFEVKSNREWHRSFGLDDRLVAIYRVLPPLS